MGARQGPANQHPRKEERDVHKVLLDPFFISKYEMTQAQWQRCREGDNPSWYFPGTERAMDRQGALPITWTNPVEFMSWTDAQLTLQHICLDLPTESQWEYAARGGTDSAYSCGDTLARIALVANCLGQEMPEDVYGNSRAPFHDGFITTSPVASYGPNSFGLYDVHGNVAEWCRDSLVRTYLLGSPGPGEGLRSPTDATDLRIIRGGHYLAGLAILQSSARRWADKNRGYRDVGARPIRRLLP